MKLLKMKYLVLLLFSVALFTSCGDDEPQEEVSSFVGDYVISEAKTSEAFSINTNEMGEVPVAEATDITAAIQASLLSQVDCDSPENSYVELRENNSMFMSCQGANELNAGTWEEVSPTELKLNMNSSAIPTSPTGYVLTVTDIAIAGANMSGKTSVPLPKEMVAVLVAPLTLTDDNPPIFMVSFSLTFVKQ